MSNTASQANIRDRMTILEWINGLLCNVTVRCQDCLQILPKSTILMKKTLGHDI